MCWNADVSINTFIFSIFVLGLVYYNNNYTKYKIHDFDNQWMYVFLLLAFSMQLIEFFIWKNINNKFYNKFFTILAFILIFCQPMASLMLLNNHSLRNIMLLLYFIFGVPYAIYTIYTKNFDSIVSKSGNLIWNIKINIFCFWIWVFLLLFSFLYERKWGHVLFAIITLSIIIYKEQSTSGSVWCWFINSISIYLAIYLLFYLPFYENKQIC
uniref:Uncharacterized protein n=1 Tax=viral metagenome TaxID=1070528 RepID=A0A6C0E2B5_9ZZZZ